PAAVTRRAWPAATDRHQREPSRQPIGRIGVPPGGGSGCSIWRRVWIRDESDPHTTCTGVHRRLARRQRTCWPSAVHPSEHFRRALLADLETEHDPLPQVLKETD